MTVKELRDQLLTLSTDLDGIQVYLSSDDDERHSEPLLSIDSDISLTDRPSVINHLNPHYLGEWVSHGDSHRDVGLSEDEWSRVKRENQILLLQAYPHA